jgi:predicted dehydrogenase
MNQDKLRWGILGTAGIARKNWKAIYHTGNGIVTAVASRDVDRGRRFIAELQAEAPFDPRPRTCGSYEALVGADDVDAIYMPLPTGMRKAWVLRAAEAGKHVLTEKPCAGNAGDLREMLEVCRRHKVQFMDGVMFMHCDRLDRLREILEDGVRVGRINRVTSAFSFRGTDEFREGNIRVNSALEPTGCLGDLGWYCIRFALWVMNWQLPRRVSGRILSERAGRGSPAAVPMEFSGELFFDGGVSSAFHCSFLVGNQMWAMVSGELGYLRVPDFVIPSPDNDVAYEFNYQMVSRLKSGLHLGPETSALTQETNQFRNFARQVRSGQLNEAWPDLALKTQQVMDACLASARADGKLAPV